MFTIKLYLNITSYAWIREKYLLLLNFSWKFCLNCWKKIVILKTKSHLKKMLHKTHQTLCVFLWAGRLLGRHFFVIKVAVLQHCYFALSVDQNYWTMSWTQFILVKLQALNLQLYPNWNTVPYLSRMSDCKNRKSIS